MPKKLTDIELLEEWELATDKLADRLVEKYFYEEADYYWVAEDRSGLIQVNDYFFNLEDITTILKNDVSWEELTEYYEAILIDKPPYNNLRHFLNLKKIANSA